MMRCIKIRYHTYLARHEQGAIHAAEGYARVSGKTGVVIATSGPGATNLVTGITDAMMDSLPLVVFTGQVANSSYWNRRVSRSRYYRNYTTNYKT